MSWIEQLPSGGYRLVDRVKINGKIRKISVPLDRDTPQAKRKAREDLDQKIREASQPVTEMPLQQAIDEYFKIKQCRESTKKAQRTILNRAVKILGPETRLSALSHGMIMRAFALSDIKPHTMNQTIGMFKTFTKWLYFMEYTQTDVGDRIQKLKDDRKEKDPEELYLEQNRLRELLDQLNGMDQMAYYMTRFLALTGLRIGEATALLPEDIGDKYISINKAYDEMNCNVSVPKTKTSIRQIFIQPELRELITEYLKWRNLDMMAYGLRPSTLFYSRRGGFYSERLYNYALPSHIHPHMLRHTHVALLAEQGMSLEAIARRLGHDGTQTTKKVYYHVTEKQKQKDEEKMASIRIL